MEATNKLKPDKYICYDTLTNQVSETNEEPEDEGSTNSSIICFNEDLPKEVLINGFWYELCHELQSSYDSCREGDTKCLARQLIYYAQMYYTQKIYLAMKLSEPFVTTVYKRCEIFYEEEQFTIPYDSLTSALNEMNVNDLMDDSKWQFQTPDECYSIGDEFSFDMELFFKIPDMRMLYKWDDTQEFLAICELASGIFPKCRREDFKRVDDFRICIEANLAGLNCFNYISEDDIARKVLYNVCKYNMSKHVIRATIEGEEIDFEEQDDEQFNTAFDSYKRFNDLFE
jgi:hypothetical protein